MLPDLRRFLEEDIGSGDVTSQELVPDNDGRAGITCESDCVVAGTEEATEIFSMLGVDAKVFFKDGSRVKAGTKVMALSGPLRAYSPERGRPQHNEENEGIATATRTAVDAHGGPGPGWPATRKTTPGFRIREKAVDSRRRDAPLGLYDMILIKDNHIAVCGGVAAAMDRVRGAPLTVKVEIEVSNESDALKAAEKGADIIMADNLPPEATLSLKEAVKSVSPGTLVEASGNITLDNVADYAGTADIVSMGCLTHSPRAMMFSLDVE
jgi:nicotinate-nucleotide pyrophosphorylase (carboxylating)